MPTLFQTQTIEQFMLTLNTCPLESRKSQPSHIVFRQIIDSQMELAGRFWHPSNPTPAPFVKWETSIGEALRWFGNWRGWQANSAFGLSVYNQGLHLVKLIILENAYTNGWEFTAKFDDDPKRYLLPFGFMEDKKFRIDPTLHLAEIGLVSVNNIEVIRHDNLVINNRLRQRSKALTKKGFKIALKRNIIELSLDPKLAQIDSVCDALSFDHRFTEIEGTQAHPFFREDRVSLPGSPGRPSKQLITRDYFLEIIGNERSGVSLNSIQMDIKAAYEKNQSAISTDSIRNHLLELGYYMKSGKWDWARIETHQANK